ncbi:MAG: hypothetical protein JWR83_2757, partial [Aeromicrobium sp.]|nr:hypothetical protein [Aeromicrobium sp.]
GGRIVESGEPQEIELLLNELYFGGER